jgi:tRNA pseudouridine13 synthase
MGGNRGNNFTIIIRNIEDKKNLRDNIHALINNLELKGFPNYYGLQRFGKFRTNSHIVGRYLLKNDYERAYNEFVTTTYSSESPRIQKIRQDLKNDGDLEKAYNVFPQSMKLERDMVKYLIDHLGDYKGTFSTLPNDLKNLLINAFQSFLFNKLITLRVNNGISLFEPANGDVISILDDDNGYITQIKYIYGNHEGYYDKYLDKAIKLNRAVIVVPIVGYETNLDDYPLMKPFFIELIEKEEINESIFKSESLKAIEFKGTFRAMTVKPIGLKINELSDDKVFPSKMKLKIEFSLPRGSYATMLLRELIK